MATGFRRGSRCWLDNFLRDLASLILVIITKHCVDPLVGVAVFIIIVGIGILFHLKVDWIRECLLLCWMCWLFLLLCWLWLLM